MSLRPTVALLCLNCLLSSASAAAAPLSWDAYGNPRFNFGICYPPAFKGEGEAGDGDGQRFQSADGAQLAVFGMNQSPGEPIDADLSSSIRELAGADARVTYHAKKSNWLVVSGVGRKSEFYVKRFLRHDQLISWEFVYPARLHARYGPLTAQLVSCFTIGAEDGY